MNNGPNKVTIDLSALVHNLRQIRTLTGKATRIMGIIKSEAYGHGLLPVAQTLERDGVDFLGVAHIREGLELRKNGIKSPIAILCGIQTREEACEVVEKELTPVIFDLRVAEILDQESARKKRKTRVHLKVDTGMGRLGVVHTEVRPFVQKVAALRNLTLEALVSHLSSADEPGGDFTQAQIEHFEEAIEAGRSTGLDLPLNNLANSAGVMGYPKAHFDMVRPGIMLYGGLPSPVFKSKIPLKPAMRLSGRISQIRVIPHHTPISYGRTYYTKGPRRIAILSTGYGDGLPRIMSNRGEVLIRGTRVPIVGMICMNLTTCDITGLGDVSPGSEAVFLGSQGQETITGDEIAKWAETISYEVFCSIGLRNEKDYVL